MTINFEYEDDKGNQYTSKEFISIPVEQDCKRVLSDLNTSPENFVGQPVPMFIEFYNMDKATQEYSQTTQMILGGIGAISLLVASLGITNTMVMSIYERTREIGIIKVLGCRLGDLRRMFLVEADIR